MIHVILTKHNKAFRKTNHETRTKTYVPGETIESRNENTSIGERNHEMRSGILRKILTKYFAVRETRVSLISDPPWKKNNGTWQTTFANKTVWSRFCVKLCRHWEQLLLQLLPPIQYSAHSRSFSSRTRDSVSHFSVGRSVCPSVRELLFEVFHSSSPLRD